MSKKVSQLNENNISAHNVSNPDNYELDPLQHPLKIPSGSDVFLTLTFDNQHQFLASPGSTRTTPVKGLMGYINKRIFNFTKYCDNNVWSIIDDMFESYDARLEMSEALASKGRYYPRLHWHLVGRVGNSIKYLFGLSVLYDMSIGYHNVVLDTEEVKTEYMAYMKKQEEEWDAFNGNLHRIVNYRTKSLNTI